MTTQRPEDHAWEPGYGGQRHGSAHANGEHAGDARMGRRSASIYVSAVLSGQRPKFDPMHHPVVQSKTEAGTMGLMERLKRWFRPTERSLPMVEQTTD